MSRPATLLLLGCTGAGKTPLGELLERDGLGGTRCVHLDFGARLRSIVCGDRRVEGVDAALVRGILEAGRLLEDDEFVIAERIIDGFLAEAGVGADDLLLLNGLPRHVSQADDVDRVLRVVRVIYLRCDAHTVYERIRLNTGGDRTGRSDDSEKDIARKLAIFADRTMPLLDHYRAKGVDVVEIDVGIETTTEQVVRRLVQ